MTNLLILCVPGFGTTCNGITAIPFPGTQDTKDKTSLVYIIIIDNIEMETTLKGTNKKTDKRTLDYKIAHAHITHARD